MLPFIEVLLPFFLILTRLSTFFLILPVFGSRVIPVRVKIAGVVLLSVFFGIVNPTVFPSSDVSELEAVILLMAEGLYGLSLGLIVSIIFFVIRVSGRITERQMGLAMAEVFDPLVGERAQPLSMLIETVFILLFLAADGHHLLFLVISRSFETFPVGTIPDIGTMTDAIVRAGSVMFTASLRVAAPMLAAFILLLVVLGVLARIAPEMNILFISLPLRVGLGLLMAALFIPFVHSFVSEFSGWMGRLLPI